jgi:hypothetical protein
MGIACTFSDYHRRHTMKRIGLILAAFLGLTAALAAPASADIVYTLNCNTVACASPTNYGTVTLKQVGSSVEVLVALAPNTFAGTGAGYAINWNITGNPSLTTTLDGAHALSAGQTFDTDNFEIKNNTVSGKTYKASPFSDDWMYAIDSKQNGGNAGNDNTLIFDVTKTGGLVLTDFVPLNGFMFAVDIWNSVTNKTFVVAAKVPEPQTWLLFLAGMAGLTALGILQRRRKLARAA